jgi:predicted naringenin-chalcone synthase
MTTAHINRIGTAVPPNDIHDAFVRVADSFLPERRDKLLFKRMVGRAGIEHRWSHFAPAEADGSAADSDGFYAHGAFPGTAARMARYERFAPELALDALDALGIEEERGRVTHLVVASCTGFMAPGLDQVIIQRAGLDPSIERTVVGYMGCYAAVNSLRVAHHIVRSEPAARVLVVNLELCSLHFHETPNLEQILSALLFGDGCAATLVTADEQGLALIDFRAAAIPGSADMITWRIGDQGFDMHLSGEVPGRIQGAMRAEVERNDAGGILRGQRPEDFDLYAVHAGGRTILDAVETGLGLGSEALHWSRGVLRDFGNMSSATLMFVLGRIMAGTDGPAKGLGMAFGPGLAAESFRFERV